MTKEQAIELAETGWWKDATPEAIVNFQLFEPLLCMDFGDFHQAVERVLGRPVFTHEFAFFEGLQKEFLKDKPAPSFEEILALLPETTRMLFVVPAR